MSQAKHTAGPWLAEQPEKIMLGERWRITAPTPKGKRRYTVAVLTDHSTDPADHAVTAADAVLIAAAPAMLDELRDTALWLGSRADVLLKLLADPAGWGRGQAATDKRQVIREEVARLQGRAFLIRQVIDKATAGA